MNVNKVTVEDIQNAKNDLKKEITNAINRYYNRTGMFPSIEIDEISNTKYITPNISITITQKL